LHVLLPGGRSGKKEWAAAGFSLDNVCLRWAGCPSSRGNACAVCARRAGGDASGTWRLTAGRTGGVSIYSMELIDALRAGGASDLRRARSGKPSPCRGWDWSKIDDRTQHLKQEGLLQASGMRLPARLLARSSETTGSSGCRQGNSCARLEPRSMRAPEGGHGHVRMETASDPRVSNKRANHAADRDQNQSTIVTSSYASRAIST